MSNYIREKYLLEAFLATSDGIIDLFFKIESGAPVFLLTLGRQFCLGQK